ncbi:MAG: response regulator [Treponema sp.]|nr:response regulator [Treponema sp.]
MAQEETGVEKEPLYKVKIIIIDDDPLVLKTIREYLKDEFEVHVARGGEGACSYLEKHPVNLILIDYEMPGEKGDSVLMNIRRIPLSAKTPAIFLTGAADPHTVAEILRSRPQGYLLKPVAREKLSEKIRAVLSGGGGESESQPVNPSCSLEKTC